MMSNQYQKQKEKWKEQGRQEIIDIIPTTWLDPLFTEYLGKKTWTSKDIEILFIKFKKQILEAQEK